MNSYCILKESHSARAALSKQILENYKKNHTFDDTEDVTTDESIIAKKFEICRSIPVKSRPCSTERLTQRSSSLTKDVPFPKRK